MSIALKPGEDLPVELDDSDRKDSPEPTATPPSSNIFLDVFLNALLMVLAMFVFQQAWNMSIGTMVSGHRLLITFWQSGGLVMMFAVLVKMASMIFRSTLFTD